MRVDEARRDDGAAEVDRSAASGGTPPADAPRRGRPRSAPSRARARSPRRPSSTTCAFASSSLTTLQRHELEPLDVDEAAVGDLQRGDHRQREEREHLERRLERRSRASRAASMSARLAATTSASGASERSPATGSGSSASTRAVDDDDAAAESASRAHRERHRRRRRCPTTTMLCASCATVEPSAPRCRPKPRTKPSRCGPVPRCRSITAIFARSRSGSATASPPRCVGSSTSDSVMIWPGTSPITRAAAALPRDPERLGRRARRSRTVCRTQSGTSGARDLVDGPAALQHELRHEALEVGEHEQVGLVAGRDRAEVREAVPGRRVERRHDERVLGRDAGRDRVAHHRVDVPVVGDVLRLAVVGAERDPRRPVLGEQRQQRVQVARRGRLADQQPHPGAQPLATLLERGGLVVGADAGGSVGVQRLPRTPGAWPSTCRASAELRELVLVAGDDAGEVHHLGQAEHAPPPQQRLEVAGRERAARRLEARRGHARRGHEVDVERELRRRRRAASGRRRCRARSRSRAGRRRRRSCRAAAPAARTRPTSSFDDSRCMCASTKPGTT